MKIEIVVAFIIASSLFLIPIISTIKGWEKSDYNKISRAIKSLVWGGSVLLVLIFFVVVMELPIMKFLLFLYIIIIIAKVLRGRR